MLIATWNVNSIKQRLDNIVSWLGARQPDIVCLQETKCIDKDFPRETFEELGYNVAIHGQKAFNGVAILSKLPFDEVSPGLAGDDSDPQARFLEAQFSTSTGVIRVANLYLPNGNPPNTDKYPYKIKWMKRLLAYAHERLTLEEPLVLTGDFNVIPEAIDVSNPEAWVNDALFLPETRHHFRALTNSAWSTRYEPRPTPPASTPSGIIRRAPGRKIAASASTTCCSRRRRPTG